MTRIVVRAPTDLLGPEARVFLIETGIKFGVASLQ